MSAIQRFHCIWVKIFNNEPSKICGRLPLKNWSDLVCLGRPYGLSIDGNIRCTPWPIWYHILSSGLTHFSWIPIWRKYFSHIFAMLQKMLCRPPMGFFFAKIVNSYLFLYLLRMSENQRHSNTGAFPWNMRNF